MDGYETDFVTDSVTECIVPILEYQDRTGIEMEDGSWVNVAFPRISPGDFAEYENVPGLLIVDLIDIVLWAIDRGYLSDPLYKEIGRTVE